MKKWIDSNDIIKEISEIGNFKGCYSSLSGTLEWYDSEKDITIYATPNWDEEGLVPFDVSLSDGEYYNVCTIKMINGDISEQFTHYLNVLMMIMNHYKDFPKVK